MKSKIIAIALISLPIAVHAQGTIRPVLDSTATCSYYNPTFEFSENAAMSKQILEVFYIVENMPKPNTPKSEIEDILNNGIQMNEKEMTNRGNIYLQCVVNCKGKAGDFQIISCPTEIANIGCQALNLFRERINKWVPGRQGGKEVDVLVKINVSVSKGNFSVVAPVI
jgi:hypothetical protein